MSRIPLLTRLVLARKKEPIQLHQKESEELLHLSYQIVNKRIYYTCTFVRSGRCLSCIGCLINTTFSFQVLLLLLLLLNFQI